MFNWLPNWREWQRDKRHGLMVFAAIGALIAIAAMFDDAGRAALGLDPDKVASGQIWRVFSGHFVHLTRMHAFMNELGLLLLIVVLWDVLEPKRLILATGLSAVSIGLGVIIFDNDLPLYVGWSGITHGLFAWGGLRLWQIGHRGYALLVLGTVLAKLIWEATQGPAPGASEAIGGLILLESHLYGALGGVAAGLLGYRRSIGLPILIAASALLVASAHTTQAHSADESVAHLFSADDGTVILALDIEVASFVLREAPGVLSDAARSRLAAMPDSDLQDYINGAGDFLLAKVRFIGADGTTAAARTIRMPSPAAMRRHAVETGDATAAPAPLLMLFDRDEILALDQPRLHLPALLGSLHFVVSRADGTQTVDILPPGIASQPLNLAASDGTWTTLATSITDGVLHVIPNGWDHAFFVALLALATPVALMCLLRATIFTLAHSITLILAGLGLVSLPQIWVEIGIALTVAVAGFDTAWQLRGRSGLQPIATFRRFRLAVIFAFGLLHGLGFASVFGALPVSRENLVMSLFGFNLGVEIGQIVVVLGMLAVLFVMQKLGSDRSTLRLRLAICVGIALFGSFWVIDRASSLIG